MIGNAVFVTMDLSDVFLAVSRRATLGSFPLGLTFSTDLSNVSPL